MKNEFNSDKIYLQQFQKEGIGRIEEKKYLGKGWGKKFLKKI